jgi:hypothetical protein
MSHLLLKAAQKGDAAAIRKLLAGGYSVIHEQRLTPTP